METALPSGNVRFHKATHHPGQLGECDGVAYAEKNRY